VSLPLCVLKELVVVIPRTLGDDTIIILSSQNSSSQWRPYCGPIFVLRENSSVFILELISRNHGILRLLNNRLVKVKSFANLNCFGNSISRPLRGTPVECLVVLNNPVHGTASLLKRGFIVRSMAENNIDIIELEAAQHSVNGFDYVLAR
jgi:hypothetical protein